MIIYSNENVEIEDDGTLHILRDASRNDVLARVKADDYGGYIVVSLDRSWRSERRVLQIGRSAF